MNPQSHAELVSASTTIIGREGFARSETLSLLLIIVIEKALLILSECNKIANHHRCK